MIGVGERQARRVQELALEPVRRACRTPGRRAPDGRSPAGARGSGACGRSPARTRSSVLCRQRALDLEVGDRGLRLVGVGARSGCARAGRGPAARRSCPSRAGGRPSTSARYSRVIARARICAPQRVVGLLACGRRGAGPTCRGRAGARCPAASGSSPPAAGPPAPAPACRCGCRGAGCTTTPGGLVDHQQVLVLVDDPNGAVGGLGLRRGGAARRPRRARRRAGRGAWAAASPSTVHRAGVDQPLRGRARAGVRGEEDVQALAGRLGPTIIRPPRPRAPARAAGPRARRGARSRRT